MYHDLGNINCTFFTKRSQYERRRNLELICSALRRNTSLEVSVNEREDIVLDGAHKVCRVHYHFLTVDLHGPLGVSECRIFSPSHAYAFFIFPQLI